LNLPGFGAGREEKNGFPNPILWGQRNIAGTQDLFNQEGDGAYPYGFFFQPPGIPAQPNPLLPWSGLPPAGQFVPFQLPVLSMFPPVNFQVNQGMPFAPGQAGGNISVTYDDGTTLVTIDNVTELDFGAWTPGFVLEDPAGSGIIKIFPPTGTGTTGNLTVNTGSTAGTGPLLIAGGSGNSFSGNITIGLNYDTTDSFNPSSGNLKLKTITTAATTDGTNELIAGVTTDSFGRTTAYKKITVDTTDSFNSTLSPTNALQLKGISVTPTAAAIPATTLATDITIDNKGRVTAETTRDIGLFKITKADRVSGDTFWTYTMRRLFDSDPTPAPITTFPFTEGRGSTFTGYNGLEVGNDSSFVYGLDVGSTSGTGDITLTGTYDGFVFSAVPIGTVVLAIKEGNVNAKWWFTAPNAVTGVCPSP
jgi:hypothetical protein